MVANSEEIYATRLPLAEAERRITTCYAPYHRALRRLVDETRERFGFCVLLDCHSMPSGAARGHGKSGRPADIVLGDCHGTSCDPRLVARAERFLQWRGYSVTPERALRRWVRQPALRRARPTVFTRSRSRSAGHLYLDEARLRRLPAIGRLRRDISGLVADARRHRSRGRPAAGRGVARPQKFTMSPPFSPSMVRASDGVATSSVEILDDPLDLGYLVSGSSSASLPFAM